MRDQRRDVGQFGLFRPQKFLARRNVEEQIAHGDHRARSRGDLVAAQNLAARDFHARPGGLVRRTRLEQQPRDRPDRRQRLAAKAERRDLVEILDVVQLAGGVAFEGQQRIVAQHAAAVVANADEAPARVLHLDAKVVAARVERVFQQFFHSRRRTLDHFARGDFIGDNVRKNANTAHEQRLPTVS